MIEYLLNRWWLLGVMIGMFILLIPGFLLAITGHDKIGGILMMCYCIPLLIWSVLILFIGMIEFIRDEFMS